MNSLFRRLDLWTLFLTLIATIIAAIGIAPQFIPARSVLEIHVSSIEELTRIPHVKGLRGNFQFDGKPVNRLIRLKLHLINTGKKTIVSDGSQSNLLGGPLNVGISPGFEFVGVALDSASFPVNIFVFDRDSLKIPILQWRQGEFVDLDIFLQSFGSDEIPIDEDTLLSVPRLEVGRQIIDGDIAVKYDYERRLPVRAYDYIRSTVWLRATGLVTQSLLLLIFGYGFIFEWRRQFNYLTWKPGDGKVRPQHSEMVGTWAAAIKFSVAILFVVLGCILGLLAFV